MPVPVVVPAEASTAHLLATARVAGPALECAQSGGFVLFDHPDSSDTKGGRFKKLQQTPGPLRCFLLSIGSRELPSVPPVVLARHLPATGAGEPPGCLPRSGKQRKQVQIRHLFVVFIIFDLTF